MTRSVRSLFANEIRQDRDCAVVAMKDLGQGVFAE